MSEHCPECGAFIGKCGCTNPKHPHSDATRELLKKEKPEKVSVEACEAALKEGFYIEDKDGNKVGFGPPLLVHIDKHHASAADRKDRKEHLLFAIDAVRNYDARVLDERKGEVRPTYFKRFPGQESKGIIAIGAPEKSEDEGCLHYIFNIHRGRSKKGKRKESRGAWPASSWHPCADAAVPDLRKDIPQNVIEDAINALNALVEVRDSAGLTGKGRTALPFRCAANDTTAARAAQGGK